MSRVTCGHFQRRVRDKWLLCTECGHGVDINTPKGQRILERARGKKKELHPLTDAAYQAMVDSYNELVAKAGTTDREVLADYANGRGEE